MVRWSTALLDSLYYNIAATKLCQYYQQLECILTLNVQIWSLSNYVLFACTLYQVLCTTWISRQCERLLCYVGTKWPGQISLFMYCTWQQPKITIPRGSAEVLSSSSSWFRVGLGSSSSEVIFSISSKLFNSSAPLPLRCRKEIHRSNTKNIWQSSHYPWQMVTLEHGLKIYKNNAFLSTTKILSVCGIRR